MEADMSVQLLDKTRKINKLLHNNNSSKVVFTDSCASTNLYLAHRIHKIPGMLPASLQIASQGHILPLNLCTI